MHATARHLVAPWAVWAALVAGCGTTPDADADAEVGDAPVGDGSVGDATVGDATVGDVTITDALSDEGSVDAGPPPRRDGLTLDFESSAWADDFEVVGDTEWASVVEYPAGSGNHALCLGAASGEWDVSIASRDTWLRSDRAQVSFRIWHDGDSPTHLGWAGPFKQDRFEVHSGSPEASFENCASGPCWAEDGRVGAGPPIRFGEDRWSLANARDTALHLRVALSDRNGARAEYESAGGWQPAQFFAADARVIADPDARWKDLDTRYMPPFEPWHDIHVSNREVVRVGIGSVGNAATTHRVCIDDLTVETRPRVPEAFPYVNPDAVVPEFVGVDGAYETVSAPDTLDLVQAARYAIHAMTAPLYREGDEQQYWLGDYSKNPPRLHFGEYETIDVKLWEAVPLLRAMTGERHFEDVDRVWQRRLVRSLAEDSGLVTFSLNKDFVTYPPESGPGSRADWRSSLRNADLFLHPILPQGRALGHLGNLFALSGDPRWQDLGRALVDGVEHIACEYTGAFGPFYAMHGNHIGPPAAAEPAVCPGAWIQGYAASELGGRLIQGPAQFFAHTGYDPARVIAQRYARYMIAHSGQFDPSTGAFLVDPEAPDEAHMRGPHVMRHTKVLEALVDYAMAAPDPSVLEFARRSFLWARGHSLAQPEVGWFPEFFSEDSISTDYGVADMIAIATKLSVSGSLDAWDDVERWTRNQFLAQQLRDIDWIEEYSDAAGPEDLSCVDEPAHRGCTTEAVAARLLGSWGGWVRPNEFTYAGGPGVMGDSTPNAARALFNVWKNAVTEEGGVLSVNLRFNRVGAMANVSSYLPYEGRVDVEVKAALTEIRVRLPAGTAPSEARVGDTLVTASMDGRYASVVGPFEIGDIVSVRYAISERSVTLEMPATPSDPTRLFTYTFRGETVIAVDPPGTRGGFYTDRLRYRGAPTLREREEFVSARLP